MAHGDEEQNLDEAEIFQQLGKIIDMSRSLTETSILRDIVNTEPLSPEGRKIMFDNMLKGAERARQRKQQSAQLPETVTPAAPSRRF